MQLNLRRTAVSVALSLVLAVASVVSPVGLADVALAGVVDVAGDQMVPAVRYAGENRYDTAALIAMADLGGEARFRPGTVVVATGDAFADALAASYAAGLTRSPVLLTAADGLPDATRGALSQLAPHTILLIGGTAAVETEVEEDLAGIARVVRVAGANRAGTAAQLARLGDADGDGVLDDGGTTAVVASFDNPSGALSAGPLSYAASYPLLLTDPDELSSEAAGAILDLGITEVLVAGGPVFVGEEVLTALRLLGADVLRVGDDYQTNLATAFARHAADVLGAASTAVELARIGDPADALALAAHAGADPAGPAPLILTEGHRLGSAAQDYLQANRCTVDHLHVAGGTAAVPSDVLVAARQAATSPVDCPGGG